MAESTSDLVVLGGGSGGYAAALRAAQLGLTVTLIEEDKLGGTCLHRGCIPTKAMLHAAEVADSAREASAFGVRASYDGVDIAALHSYRTGVVDRLYKGLQGLVSGRGINQVQGRGTLQTPRTVQVGTDTHTATTAVLLATGSYARTIPGIAIGGRVLSSSEALELDYVPASAVVIGGGVIGVEFASVWTSFGAQVTIVEALPNLLPAEDPAISKMLERTFKKRKVGLKLRTRVAAVEQDDRSVTVTLHNGESLSADVLLVAVGRGPRTEHLGYDEVGVRREDGFIVVDDQLQTSVPGVYAAGDIVAGLQLAHRGFQQGILVAEVVAGLEPTPVREEHIPRITYCDPEVASVGLTEHQAREQYGDEAVQSITYNLGGNGKSQILATAGMVKIVRQVDGPVVGVHMIGARVGELIGEAQLAVAWEAHPQDAAALVHAHPTQNEALGEAFLALAGKPLHAHD